MLIIHIPAEPSRSSSILVSFFGKRETTLLKPSSNTLVGHNTGVFKHTVKGNDYEISNDKFTSDIL